MSETVGSQRLLQATVHDAPRFIDPLLRQELGLSEMIKIDWRSPIAADKYKEYRDGEALAKLGVTLDTLSLSQFWPARGPVWDGLARASSGEVILVEAKAHIAEIASPPSAAGEEAMKRIEAAFALVRRDIAPRSSASWTSTFYQYANRLAFLYLLRKNNVDAHLVHVLFLNAKDVNGPETVAEWHGALELLRAALGVRNHLLKRFVHELYIDAASVETTLRLQLMV